MGNQKRNPIISHFRSFRDEYAKDTYCRPVISTIAARIALMTRSQLKYVCTYPRPFSPILNRNPGLDKSRAAELSSSAESA